MIRKFMIPKQQKIARERERSVLKFFVQMRSDFLRKNHLQDFKNQVSTFVHVQISKIDL